MKKIWAALLAAGLSLSALGAADAMDAATLAADGARYRVIYADGGETVYADMSDISSMQSRDMPSSLEHFYFTMYVVDYAKNPDAMDFETAKFVTSIREYKTYLLGFKAEGRYELKGKFEAAYDGRGNAIEVKDERINAAAADMYNALLRANRAKQKAEAEK